MDPGAAADDDADAADARRHVPVGAGRAQPLLAHLEPLVDRAAVRRDAAPAAARREGPRASGGRSEGPGLHRTGRRGGARLGGGEPRAAPARAALRGARPRHAPACGACAHPGPHRRSCSTTPPRRRRGDGQPAAARPAEPPTTGAAGRRRRRRPRGARPQGRRAGDRARGGGGRRSRDRRRHRRLRATAFLVRLHGKDAAFFHGEDARGDELYALEHLLQRTFGEALRPRSRPPPLRGVPRGARRGPHRGGAAARRRGPRERAGRCRWSRSTRTSGGSCTSRCRTSPTSDLQRRGGDGPARVTIAPRADAEPRGGGEADGR